MCFCLFLLSSWSRASYRKTSSSSTLMWPCTVSLPRRAMTWRWGQFTRMYTCDSNKEILLHHPLSLLNTTPVQGLQMKYCWPADSDMPTMISFYPLSLFKISGRKREEKGNKLQSQFFCKHQWFGKLYLSLLNKIDWIQGSAARQDLKHKEVKLLISPLWQSDQVQFQLWNITDILFKDHYKFEWLTENFLHLLVVQLFQ